MLKMDNTYAFYQTIIREQDINQPTVSC